jgi:hypothetical protein
LTESTTALPELFHRITDLDSVEVRRRAAELGLADRVLFRNVHFDDARADFQARGGVELPALWDGARLWQGREAVLAVLAALAA